MSKQWSVIATRAGSIRSANSATTTSGRWHRPTISGHYYNNHSIGKSDRNPTPSRSHRLV